MLLTSMYSVVVGFVHVFITNNMFEMANTIRYGRLDAILMKPMDSQLMISVKEINYPTMPRVLTGCLLVLYFLGKLNTFPTFSEIAIFFVLSFSSVILLYSFWFTVMVLTIYFPELWNLIDLLIHFTDIAKYPGEMYHGLGQFIAFLLPMTLIVSLPAKTVLGILQYNDAVLLVGISFLFFFVSRIAWKTALRHYTSASN
jgi:ABC-2 type transport system permease protein